ncbi:hypothetical protein B9479_007434 [Cryptococcus floricola]|uniref:Ricin B lectin domain-containing protein n=1 Tax=Cryptococcus floricola TaxID=2591691 RepID=A0A5D3AMU9_9TREE|nr:hypothetical protein B9479_007434 [Cryptococcus floricola]
MFKLAALAALIPLAFAAPTGELSKRDDSTHLNCVRYQYSGPFTSTGFNGQIHFYSNITSFDSDSQTTSFNESRLGLASDGSIQPCGDCRTTELFGFEVCETDSQLAFNGLKNSAHSFYGHVTYSNVSPTHQCLAASRLPREGSPLALRECEYDYDNAAASGQYWQITTYDESVIAMLVDEQDSYGPTPELNNNGSLVLYDPVGANKTFTYFGFKAQEF